MGDWLARRPPSIRKGSVDLEALDEFFLEPYLEMLADPEVARLTGPAPKFTQESIVEWLTTRPLAEGRLDWAIRESQLGEFVGEIVLNEYDIKDNSMNLRIALRGPHRPCPRIDFVQSCQVHRSLAVRDRRRSALPSRRPAA